MKDIHSKIAYIEGLAEGLNVNNATREGRIMHSIIDVLGDIADQMEDVQQVQDDMQEYLVTIDEDLNDVEEEIYDIQPVEAANYDEDIDDDLDFDEADLVEVECPQCQEIVCFEADLLEDDDIIEITCPNCDEIVFVNDEIYEGTFSANLQNSVGNENSYRNAIVDPSDNTNSRNKHYDNHRKGRNHKNNGHFGSRR